MDTMTMQGISPSVQTFEKVMFLLKLQRYRPSMEHLLSQMRAIGIEPDEKIRRAVVEE